MEKLKICGIWYCNETEEEYNQNIKDKINKLEHKIKLWNSRNLTFEGKILIIKTFGISQLIYVMQVCKIEDTCIKSIERIIFGFIWRAHRSERDRGIDRIKRSILKNKYVEGGLNVTDIECLDKSLKTRQYVRADKSKHPIKSIQLYCTENLGLDKAICQGYGMTTNREGVTMVAHTTINTLNAAIRKELNENVDIYKEDVIAVNYAGSIDIKTFLKMSNNKLIECVYRPLLREGVETLHELVGELEIEHDRNRLRRLRMVLQAFPAGVIELASNFNEDNNTDTNVGYKIMGENNNWLDLNKVTTKELQAILKIRLGKVSPQDHKTKLGIEVFDKESIMKFRNKCKNIKLRHVFYRLISGDIFSKERMCRFGMTNSNICERCQQVESTKHLLWGCIESRNIWELFNVWLTTNSRPVSNLMNEYQDIYRIDECAHVCKVKMKIIQEMIQIQRPSGWNMEKIKLISNDIKRIELYNKNKNLNAR